MSNKHVTFIPTYTAALISVIYDVCSQAALQLDGIAGIVLFLVSLILLETEPDSGLVVLTLTCAFNVSSSVLIPNLSFV